MMIVFFQLRESREEEEVASASETFRCMICPPSPITGTRGDWPLDDVGDDDGGDGDDDGGDADDGIVLLKRCNKPDPQSLSLSATKAVPFQR